MLLKSRPFTRFEVERDAKKIYIFCEGKDREYNYFNYFVGIDTRLNLIIYQLQGDENNSPKGLYELAKKCLIKTEDNPAPKYDYRIDEDIVWIVLDTDRDRDDSRKLQLVNTRFQCRSMNWNIAQSNPCFEVWLYYHQENKKPNFDEIQISAKWKTLLGQIIIGGFDSRKHPIFIQTAIENSKNHFQQNEDDFPDIATTEVFKLAQHILEIGRIRENIESALQRMQTSLQ